MNRWAIIGCPCRDKMLHSVARRGGNSSLKSNPFSDPGYRHIAARFRVHPEHAYYCTRNPREVLEKNGEDVSGFSTLYDSLDKGEVWPMLTNRPTELTAPETREDAPRCSDPEEWVDLHGDVLYRFALLRLRDPELAADAVQDTLLDALRGRDTFSGRSSERWLRLTKHLCSSLVTSLPVI